MSHKNELGQKGEEIVCQYLANNSYKIIDRNFRVPWGELDIIAIDLDKVLVFVEVKTVKQMSQNNESGELQLITPEDQLTKSKLRKLRRTAEFYARANQELINEEVGWRIDLIALTINEENYLINHYKNIEL